MITRVHSNAAGPAPWPSQFAVFLFGRGGVCVLESCDFGYWFAARREGAVGFLRDVVGHFGPAALIVLIG
jgi:hypothetical protein